MTDPAKVLPPLVLGVGDGFGFAVPSPAKIALADGLEAPGSSFELRIHGVGGSSPEKLLEQSDTTQVGGDSIAQFLRRWAPSGKPRGTVRWPLEGYWWGGLTSRPSTRAFWVLLIPLLLCNLASWMIPSFGPADQVKWRRRFAAWMLPPVMRLAGYVLTLVLTASLVTASMDTFGWQCALAPKRAASGGGTAVSCLPGWLHWTPAAAGPRLAVFAVLPVLILALIGYASTRTLRAYELWTLPPGLPRASGWPLTADGFWHGLRPVRRQQLLHLAGAGALIGLYLAKAGGSHPAAGRAAVVGALVLLALPAAMLASPRAGRPGVNPHDRGPADLSITGFDWVSGGLLGLSGAGVLTLGLVRIWWHPAVPRSRPVGLLAGDSGTWWGLTIAMGCLVLAAFILASMARDIAELQQDRPFARGYLGTLTLGLAFVSAGIFAGGLNLLLPNSHIIPPEFHNTGPAISGVARGTYPLVLPAPVDGFMVALLALGAALLILVFVGIFWFWLQSWGTSRVTYLNRFYGAELGAEEGLPTRQTRSQRWRIARSWTLAKVADYTGVIIAALASAGILGMTAFTLVAFGAFPSWPSRIYWVTTLAHDGQWLGLIVAAYLYKLTRDAFADGGKRRAIGVLWDVGTFWPRASQPFAPPCYMERSVPETVNRLRRALGDEVRGEVKDGAETSDPAADPAERAYIGTILRARLGHAAASEIVLPPQERILINGYSQGSPIGAAVIAQLPDGLTAKVSFVTVGSPLRRLYGQGFPAYFGQRWLTELADRLSAPDRTPRWRNLRRPSDYIGSYIFRDPMIFPAPAEHAAQVEPADPAAQVEPAAPAKTADSAGPAGPARPVVSHIDQLVLDPPRIIPAPTPAPPPIHAHSDFWPDPQVALITSQCWEAWRAGKPADPVVTD